MFGYEVTFSRAISSNGVKFTKKTLRIAAGSSETKSHDEPGSLRNWLGNTDERGENGGNRRG
jgi:hypothetical protein